MAEYIWIDGDGEIRSKSTVSEQSVNCVELRSLTVLLCMPIDTQQEGQFSERPQGMEL